MKTAYRIISITLLAVTLAGSAAFGARIKDVARVAGVRENQLFGYGLVVGLAGTGDGVRMTKQTIANLLERLGINVAIGDINANNTAAVMVTASLPSFVKSGDSIDAVVSSVGDANTLRGGTLLMTPLKGADGKVYAVAQGAISLGGWSEKGGGGSNKKGHPNVGRIAGGASVEREVPAEIISQDNNIYLNLNNPDFTTAAHISDKINLRFGKGTAKATDSATIKISVPDASSENVVPFISEVENLQIEQDQVAKVVINEKTGTIVMGGDVTITPVAIAHGTLTVSIKPNTNVNQPLVPFAGGNTVVIPQSTTKVVENKVAFTRVSASDIVDAMNKMKVTASDIIAIFQALKVSGALQAELVVM
ncbi:MAG: flagellar basal body P-ring protein FlgI [bacterium]